MHNGRIRRSFNTGDYEVSCNIGFYLLLCVFYCCQIIKNNSIVDIGWGMGFVLIAISTLGILDYIGLTIWLIGYYFEVVGGRQLKEFLAKHKNKGKIMKEGLWQYTQFQEV